MNYTRLQEQVSCFSVHTRFISVYMFTDQNKTKIFQTNVFMFALEHGQNITNFHSMRYLNKCSQ